MQLQLSDAASWATILGTAVAAVALTVAVMTLITSVRQAVSDRQRVLRGQLRTLLRSVSEACEDYQYAGRRTVVANTFLKAANELERILDEGILSPSPSQIDRFRLWVRHLAAASSASVKSSGSVAGVGGIVIPGRKELAAKLEERTNQVIDYVAALSNAYRRATRQMDNGHYGTYLRYRRFPPDIREPFPLESASRDPRE